MDGYKKLIHIISRVLCVAVIAVFFAHYFGRSVIFTGSSMAPVIKNTDVVLINSLTYRLSSPDRYDCIAFTRDTGTGIKRIVGLPGETVSIEDGYIYINGVKTEYYKEPISAAGDAVYGVTVPEGCYFVIGDSPSFSLDSRYNEFGFVSKNDILGKVWFTIYPVRDLGPVK
ncbi:MAG: signal peptidase I [Lachnospiraceae bacterium]|nr:signal peptidase I [Lachnospiraceae bacterium]